MDITCYHCLGTGKESDGSDCKVCGGSGTIVACFYGATLAQLKAIIAEQASQRAVLTKIWNKVK